MIDQLKPLLGKLALFSQERLGFKNPPKLFLRNDSQNSQQALGKTAFYNPEEQSVTLFIHGRHPKDILRSFTHELVHHCQNERGDLSPDKMTAQGPGYAQECPHMRKMEQEAYLEGNMCFRDWEDTIEDKDLILIKLAESTFLKENKQMTTKITKEFLKETIRKVLQERAIFEGPEDDYRDYLKQVNILKSLLAGIPQDSAEKTKWYADPANKSYIQQVANMQASLEKLDGKVYDKGTSGGRMKANLGSLIPQLKKPQASPTQPKVDGAMASVEPVIGMGGGTVPTPSVKPQKPVAGGGAASGAQKVRRKKAQQVRILKTNALPGLAGVNNIKQLQQRLVDAGYASDTLPNGKPFVDGDYGDASQKAMMKLQKEIGAGSDGVMGTGTYTKLLGYTKQNPESKANVFFKGPAAASAERPMRNYLARENNELEEERIANTDDEPRTEKEYQARDAKELENQLAQTRQQRRNNAKDTVAKIPKEGIDLDESNCGSGKRKDGEPCGNKKCKTCYPMEEGKLPDGLQKYQDEKAGKKTDDSKSEKKCSSCGGKKPDDGCPHCDGDAPRSKCKCGHDDKDSEKSKDSKNGKMPMIDEPEGQDLNKDGKKGSGKVPAFLKKESKIQTPEQENALYEQRFAPKNNRLFEKLVKEWTK